MRTRMRWAVGSKQWLLVAGLALLAPVAVFAASVFDFEDLPVGTTITNQYVDRGVRFYSAYLASDPAARSGTRVLRTVSPTAEVFTPIPLRMTFVLNGQMRVKFFAMSPGIARNGTLTAFDANGVVIAKDGPKLVAADKFTTMFEINLSSPLMRSAELQLEDASHYAIDDLEFDSLPAPLVQVIETPQPAAKDNASVNGNFPATLPVTPLPGVGATSPESENETDEQIEFAGPPSVIKELLPGASAELVTHLNGPATLAGSVRWIGTATPSATLSLDGATLDSGKAYALGANRGGAELSGIAKTGGNVKLSVTNSSNVSIKVRLSLSFVRGQAQ